MAKCMTIATEDKSLMNLLSSYSFVLDKYDYFSLVKHRSLARFAKLSGYMVFKVQLSRVAWLLLHGLSISYV